MPALRVTEEEAVKVEDQRMRAFLADLREVLAKHDATISSCSCCDGVDAAVGRGKDAPRIRAIDLSQENDYSFTVDRIDRALAAE